MFKKWLYFVKELDVVSSLEREVHYYLDSSLVNLIVLVTEEIVYGWSFQGFRPKVEIGGKKNSIIFSCRSFFHLRKDT